MKGLSSEKVGCNSAQFETARYFFVYLFALNNEFHKKWWRVWVHHAMFVIEYDDDG